MRRFLRILAGLALGLVLLLATLPYWLPWAARPVAAHYGASFGGYERKGYSRFVLRDVRVDHSPVRIAVEQVEADTPLLWTWRHFRRAPTVIAATRWSVEVVPRGERAKAGARRMGWRRLQGILQRVGGGLDRWLAAATLGAGVVRWPTGDIALEAATWRSSRAGDGGGVMPPGLQVTNLRFRSLAADAAALRFLPGGEMQLTARSAAADAELSLATRQAAVVGDARWAGQGATLAAEFLPDGWLPRMAKLDVPVVKLPAERARLKGYGNVTGRAHATWNGEILEARVDLEAAPLPERNLPELVVKLAADAAGRDRWRLTQLEARIPGGEARLSGPVSIDRQGRWQGAAAELRFRFDLAAQPWMPAAGVLTGRAVASASDAGIPDFAWSVEGADLRLQSTALRRFHAEGDLHWPRLRLREVQLTGPAGETLRGGAEVDFVARELARASVSGEVNGQTLAAWLPPTLAFGQAEVRAEAAGPLAALRHEGQAIVRPITLGRVAVERADVRWKGEGRAINEAAVSLAAGAALVSAKGRIDAASTLRLESLHWTHAGTPVLALKAPATVRLRPTLTIEALHLAGPEAAVDARMTWGAVGRVDVAVRGLPSEVLRPFRAESGLRWAIRSWAITGSWAEGPMTFSSAGEATFALPEQRTATVRAAFRGDGQGLWVDALHALEGDNAVVNASGRLPVVVTPWGNPEPRTTPARASRWFELNPDGPLGFEAVTVPNAAFWQQFGAVTGIELDAPQLTARLEGTWREPRGHIEFHLTRATMNARRFARPLPTVEKVDLSLIGTASSVQLKTLTFTVEGQAVKAEGELALEETGWLQLWREPGRLLRERGRFNVQVPEAQVAMFARFLPAALAPAGRLAADLRFDAGQLNGVVRLREAASRPLGPLGVLQQVSADVEFRGRRIVLERVSATSGGQPVTLTGDVELPAGGWISGPEQQPRYNIVLRGTNVPFVRQAGLLIRGDLDLALRSNREGAAAISGRVELRDSLFLTDVRSYLPRGAAASPARRPPYFSVDTPPLDGWALDVTVSGSRFLRVRMPVFSGIASTRFHLGGTLGEPRAIGDATIDEGAVLMPFTRFELQQGVVRLTEESPYEPTVFLRGTGRHYGYDLTMEISGTASTPNLTFSSSPALDPDQVLVMVTTGAAPTNEVSTSLTRRAVQIGAFVGQSLLGSLGGGGVEPGRLSVESGERISRQGRETYSIEYKLNGRWSVTGEYDEFDEYNAGFKWRVAPKERRK